MRQAAMRLAYLGTGVLALVSLWPSQANAYCMERTCKDELTSCATDERGCVSEGLALSYADGCLSFAVERGAGAPLGLGDFEFHDVVWEAFERWRFVDCGGGSHPSFSIQSAGVVDAYGKYFCAGEPSLNLGVWRAAEECDDSAKPCWRHEGDSLGYTTLTFEPRTGKIVDADVELSVPLISELDAPGDQRRELLLAIATHEAGHVLGISHSDTEEAIMAARYSLDRLLSYSFTEDDIAAVCDAFPPRADLTSCASPTVDAAAWDVNACAEAEAKAETDADPEPDATGVDQALQGCGVAAPRSSQPPWVALMMLALAMVRRRKGR
jgi:hypothetical protein